MAKGNVFADLPDKMNKKLFALVVVVKHSNIQKKKKLLYIL